MAPLPENNTDRLWLFYTAKGVEHSVIFRFSSTIPQADQVAAAADFANAVKAYVLTTDSFTKVLHQDAGSHLTFPLAWTAITGTNTDSTENDDEPHFVSATGRSLDGRRVKIGMYLPRTPDSIKYREARTPGSLADAYLDAIDGMEPAPVSISGGAVVWNQYMNTGYNAYWQRQNRKG